MDLPAAFRSRMRTLMGCEADELFAALEAPAVAGLRVNPGKAEVEAVRRRLPWPLRPVPWCGTGFTLARDQPRDLSGQVRPGLHPLHAAGLYYLQDPTAMAPAEALAPRPGERVVDLAAAPGGKSTHLSSLLEDAGLLVANDVHPGRARTLARNLERWGARNKVTTSAPIGTLAGRWGGLFDRALLDAPCSGEGMFRKSAEAIAAWGEASVLGCARRQRDLLELALRLVRPGGTLVYSTCTFAPEENEQVVADLLDRRSDVELVPLELPGSEPGRPEWAGGRQLLERTRRLWPHRVEGDGHFLALLRRTGPAEDNPLPLVAHEPAPAAAVRAWRGFAAEALAEDPYEGGPLTLRADLLLAPPDGLPPLAGIRAISAGVRLGRLRKGRFEPDHELAASLRPEEVGARIDLEPGDPRLARYLEGHPLDDPGGDGWLLVTVSGHPLGWGRRSRGIVKNRYPKGLRTR